MTSTSAIQLTFMFCTGIQVEDVSAGGGIEYGKHEGTNHKIHFIIVMGLHKII